MTAEDAWNRMVADAREVERLNQERVTTSAGMTQAAFERALATRSAFDTGQPAPRWDDLTIDEQIIIWSATTRHGVNDLEYAKWIYKNYGETVLQAAFGIRGRQT